MPNFGLSKPWIAKYNPETGKYSDAFKCGRAINTAVTPNYNEAVLHADNQVDETVAEFKNANVTLGVNTLPIKAVTVMFGHTVTEKGEEINNTSDSGSYVGYGFIVAEMEKGKKKYRACILTKVLFKEGEESYETKGDSITFKNPTLSGTASSTDDGVWRIKSPTFVTENEADLWIREKFNVPEPCKMPEASTKGGEYKEALSVTLATTTPGAKIRYTIDGSEPSETNGTEYSEAVEITESTDLKAVAYKENTETSAVMVETYVITGNA